MAPQVAVHDQRRDRSRNSSVRKEGVEPSRELPHRNLNPARLPVPPLSLGRGVDAAPARRMVGLVAHEGRDRQAMSGSWQGDEERRKMRGA